MQTNSKLQSCFNKFETQISFILTIYILAQSIIDIFTSLGNSILGVNLSVGIIIRSIFMITVTFIAILYCIAKKRILLGSYLIISIIYCCVFSIYSFATNPINVFLIDVKGLIKTFYLIFTLVSLFIILREVKVEIKTKAISYSALMYIFSIVIAVLTNTSKYSYYYEQFGYKGWFNAANEVGTILGIIIPIMIYYFASRNMKWYFTIIVVLASMFCVVYMGVKSIFIAVAGYLIISFIYCVIQFWITKNKSFIRIISILMLCIVLCGFFYSTSELAKKINNNIDKIVEEVPSSDNIKDLPNDVAPSPVPNPVQNNVLNIILSNRLLFVGPIHNTYISTQTIDKIIGIGYTHSGTDGQIETKMIEIDTLDIFYAHGFIGCIIYYFPILFLLCRIVGQIFKNFKYFITSYKYCTYFYSLCISLLISTTAGHVMTAPGVSIYIALLMLKFYFDFVESEKYYQVKQ